MKRLVYIAWLVLGISLSAYSQRSGTSERSTSRSDQSTSRSNQSSNRSESGVSKSGSGSREATTTRTTATDNRSKSTPQRESAGNSRSDNNSGNSGTTTRTRTTTTTRSYSEQPSRGSSSPANRPGEARHSSTRTGHSTNNHVTVEHHHSRPVVHRNNHYVRSTYRTPAHVHVSWDRYVYDDYCRIYPEIVRWGYRPHYNIFSVPAYEAYHHIGEIRNVYGKVYETYYIPQTDEYILYIGYYYPYQEMTIVLPGHIARLYSRHPERYFKFEYINVTGLITAYEGKPELYVKRTQQLRAY